MKPVCLVTGAGGRLGQDLCHALADEYELVVTYRSGMPSVPGMLVQADLGCRDGIAHVVDAAMARHGRVDALVNSAADIRFHGSLRNLWPDADYAQSQLLLNAIVPMQIASKLYHDCWRDHPDDNVRWNRSVINVSSISGLTVFKDRGQALYGVSKAALNMLTLYLSLEFAPCGVRVNAVCPSQFQDAAATRRVTESIRELLGSAATGAIVTGIP
jgi:NAD(P)-dependent dehydrogenase (short-subunit alcohol dehydrogenase family)